MAASSGVTEGTSVNLYWDDADTPAVISTASVVEGLAVSGNLVSGVTDIGATENTINVIEYNTYGTVNTQKIAGMRNFGDFTVEFAIDNNDAIHTAIRGGDDRKLKTFVVAVVTDDSAGEETFAAVQGYISSVGVTNAVDGVATCAVTLTLAEPVQYHDHS